MAVPDNANLLSKNGALGSIIQVVFFVLLFEFLFAYFFESKAQKLVGAEIVQLVKQGGYSFGIGFFFATAIGLFGEFGSAGVFNKFFVKHGNEEVAHGSILCLKIGRLGEVGNRYKEFARA